MSSTLRTACLIAFVAMAGCRSGDAQGEAKTSSAGAADIEQQLTQVKTFKHITPQGRRHECLGRLVFDAPRDMVWATGYVQGGYDGIYNTFSDGLRQGRETLIYNGIAITVVSPATPAQLDRWIESRNAAKTITLAEWKKDVETRRHMIESLKSNPNKEDPQAIKAGIADSEKDIAEAQARIASIESEWHPIDLGMANSRGYRSGRNYYAFLYRDGHAFRIQATDERISASERERRFRKFIGSFAARKQFDVPKQPGVCIPHGFIPDDGQGDYQTTMSLRQDDRPGVIYTIDTGLLSENGYATRPQPGALKAAAVALTGVLASSATEGRVEKSIGPRGAKIGPLSASQGGVSVNTADEGKPKVPSYSVYTAYDGQMNVQALPFIVVQMRSWTSEQVPDLKQDPPPMNESMGRLDALIGGMWLRPIDPRMPKL